MSVLQDEKAGDLSRSKAHTVYAHLKMVKMIQFLLRVFYQKKMCSFKKKILYAIWSLL